MRIVLLTEQNSNTCFKLVKQLVTRIPESDLDIYFGKIERTKKSKIQRQIKNIKRNGLMWIPYRSAVAISNIFKRDRGNDNIPTLIGNILEYEKVTLKIVTSFDSKELWQEIGNNKYELGIVFGTGIIKKGLFTLPNNTLSAFVVALASKETCCCTLCWRNESGITSRNVSHRFIRW